MAKAQVNSPALPGALAFSCGEPLVVANDAGVILILDAEADVVRVALTWPEVSEIVQKVLNKIQLLLERKVN